MRWHVKHETPCSSKRFCPVPIWGRYQSDQDVRGFSLPELTIPLYANQIVFFQERIIRLSQKGVPSKNDMPPQLRFSIHLHIWGVLSWQEFAGTWEHPDDSRCAAGMGLSSENQLQLQTEGFSIASITECVCIYIYVGYRCVHMYTYECRFRVSFLFIFIYIYINVYLCFY